MTRALIRCAVATAALVGAIGVSAAHAQQPPDLRTVPGSWKPFARDVVPGTPPAWLTRTDVQAMLARLADVADVFRKSPPLAAPVGLVVYPTRTVNFHDRVWAQPRESDRRWLVPGDLMLSAVFYELDAKTRKPVAPEHGTGLVFHVLANQLSCVLGRNPWESDAEGTMYLEPQRAGEVHGFPKFGDCVAVTRRSQPVFVPVSQERILTLRIGQMERQLADARKYDAIKAGPARQQIDEATAAIRTVQTSLRGQLQSLDAAARRVPAYVLESPDPRQPLVPGGSEGARLVVQPNPQFFDASRPGDIQHLSVYIDCAGDWCDQHRAILDQLLDRLDWKALAGLTR